MQKIPFFNFSGNLGDHCLESDQCPENAACVGEKCICNTGFVPDGDVCREGINKEKNTKTEVY